MAIKTSFRFALSVAAVAWSYSAAAEEVVLTSAQISQQMAGKEINGQTKDGRTIWLKIGKDGTAWGKVGSHDITMTYEIKDDKWCRSIGSNSECQAVKRDGNTVKLYSPDGTLSSSFQAND